jgi:integrase
MGDLTNVQIEHWVRAGKPLAKSDGNGLTFTLSTKGTASWVLRYRVPGTKSQKELTLGRYKDISLAEARSLASVARGKVQQGIDVGREKQKNKRAAARAWTLRRLADDHLERAASRLAESTVSGRRQQLRDYVLPQFGNLPARDVTPADVVNIVERAAEKSLHVARLVLVALREVFAHGIARHVIEIDPCAHVKGTAVIGPRPLHRTRIKLTDAELRTMLRALPMIGRTNELIVKVLLATGARIGELINSQWEFIDFEHRVWTIPPERSKNGKRFVIPLTDQVSGWFSELYTLAFGSRFACPARLKRSERYGDGRMESSSVNAAINRLCRELEGRCRRFTPHDLRSTARSHLGALGIENA